MKPVYVLTMNYQVALIWAQRNGIHRSNLVYINTPEQLRGLRDIEVIDMDPFRMNHIWEDQHFPQQLEAMGAKLIGPEEYKRDEEL